MTDKALENAKALKMRALKELQRLEDESRVWRNRVSMADQFIEQWNAFAGGLPVNSVDSVSTNGNKTAPSAANRRPIRNSKKEDVAAAARHVILDRGSPIMRDELFNLLTSQGMVIQGKDPRMVLSTMLWRMRDQIARMKDGGYWPADIPNEKAGYDPSAVETIIERRVDEELRAIGDDAEAEGLL